MEIFNLLRAARLHQSNAGSTFKPRKRKVRKKGKRIRPSVFEFKLLPRFWATPHSFCEIFAEERVTCPRNISRVFYCELGKLLGAEITSSKLKSERRICERGECGRTVDLAKAKNLIFFRVDIVFSPRELSYLLFSCVWLFLLFSGHSSSTDLFQTIDGKYLTCVEQV